MRKKGLLLFVFLIGLPASARGSGDPLDDPRLDPALRLWLSRSPGRPGTHELSPFSAALPGPGAAGFVVFDGPPERLARLGFSVLSATGGMALVKGPESAYRRLPEWEGLRHARLTRPVRENLDLSLQAIGAHEIRHGTPPGYDGSTGRGVIVGIVDTGVDIYHPDFRQPDGRSRVIAFWDQYATGTSREVPVGFLYREADIERLLRHNDPWAVPLDLSGHGTHVAGIAAGNGAGGAPYRYVGVAPEADIVVVRTLLDEGAVVEAVRFVMDEAERRRQPAVVNLSLGNQYGPHNGQDPFEKLISDFCGPGRHVCVSGGNDGGLGIHALMPGGEGPDSVSVIIPVYSTDAESFHVVQVEGWLASSRRFRHTIVMPDGTRIGPVPAGRPAEIRGRSYVVRSGIGATHAGQYLFMEAFFNSRPSVAGEWMIVVEPVGGPSVGPVHFWIPLSDFGSPRARFGRGEDPRATLSPPANGFNVLAVSATVSKTCWIPRGEEDWRCYDTDQRPGELADFSSLGPTPDGREKPEIAAPGLGIVSALTSTMAPAVRDIYGLASLLDPDGRHWINSGTSMSAPHATGAVALLLSRAREADPEDVRARLRSAPPAGAPPGTFGGRQLNLNLLASPIALVSLFEARLQPDRRVLVEWYPIPLSGDPVFRLWRSRDGGETFETLPAAERRERGPHDFVDGPLEPGRKLVYRLTAADSLGVEDDLGTVSVEAPGLPGLTLRAPWENPSRLPLFFSFFLAAPERPGPYALDLFDVAGRHLARVAEGVHGPEEREFTAAWDGTTPGGRRARSGVYWARLSFDGRTRVVRFIVRP